MAQVDHPRILAIDPEGYLVTGVITAWYNISISCDHLPEWYIYVPDSRNHRVRKISIGDRYTEENIYVEPSGIAYKFSDTGLHLQTFDLDSGVVLMEFEHDSGHLEKLLFCPISLSQQKIKCSHMFNMLRFYFLLFLELEQNI